MPKYLSRTKFRNDSDLYEDYFEDRDVESIEQFTTMKFNNEALKKEYSVINHVWSKGDKFYKLAHRYYGRRDYWWLISMWNGTPTEAHCFYGLNIQIPFPPVALLRGITNGE